MIDPLELPSGTSFRHRLLFAGFLEGYLLFLAAMHDLGTRET